MSQVFLRASQGVSFVRTFTFHLFSLESLSGLFSWHFRYFSFQKCQNRKVNRRRQIDSMTESSPMQRNYQYLTKV